jgi:probable DNA metabolism protein
MKTIYIYDGSFEGFLTAVYTVFDTKKYQASIVSHKHYRPDMFAEVEEIPTNSKMAKLVWKSLVVKATKVGSNKVYRAFLSEIKGIENVLLRYIIYVYKNESFIHTDYTNKDVLRVTQIAQMVNREQERTEEAIKFKVDAEGVRIAMLRTDFNLLPLIARHFKNKYSNLKWELNDTKRGYGLSYDLHSIKATRLNNNMLVKDVVQFPTYGNEAAAKNVESKIEPTTLFNLSDRKDRLKKLQHTA